MGVVYKFLLSVSWVVLILHDIVKDEVDEEAKYFADLMKIIEGKGVCYTRYTKC